MIGGILGKHYAGSESEGAEVTKAKSHWAVAAIFSGCLKRVWSTSGLWTQVLAAKGKEVMRLSPAMLLRSKHLAAQNGINSRLITATKRA